MELKTAIKLNYGLAIVMLVSALGYLMYNFTAFAIHLALALVFYTFTYVLREIEKVNKKK